MRGLTIDKWASSLPFYVYMIKWKDTVKELRISMDNYWIYYPYEWMNDFISPWLIDPSGPVKENGMPFETNPGYVFDETLTSEAIFLKKVYTNKKSQQTFRSSNGYMSYFNEGESYRISPATSGAYANEGTEVANGMDLNGASIIEFQGSFYAAGNLFSSYDQRSVSMENVDDVYDGYSYNNVFVRIADNERGYALERLTSLPEPQSVMTKLFAMDESLNAVTFDRSGHLKVFRYYDENDAWEEIGELELDNSAPSFSSLNVINKSAFFTVLKSDGTYVYKFGKDSGFENKVKISDEIIPFSKISGDDDTLVFADMRQMGNGQAVIFTLKDGVLDRKNVEIEMANFKLEKDDYSKEFCIYEKENSIFPGTTYKYGVCIPVEEYNYDAVTYFDYKRTIAGYSNNLYLGGLSGVRRVEIGENGELKNRELVVTGEVHNLAKYENALYGANGSEIEIFSIEENGSLTEVDEIGASSCRNIRTSGKRLFTAENGKVRVYNLDDPFIPQLEYVIETGGKVIDLEILGNILYIYKEMTSWFTTKGYSEIYDISNIDSPEKLHSFKRRCKDAEMQRSGNTIHLGCKNGQYIIEEDSLVEVSGEKNYVREGYVFDNILYQVFSGKLHKSKAGSSLPVCGNGVVEFGEICDGNVASCSSVSSNWSGTAVCNSTCDGYNEENCEEDDGW